MRSEADNKMPEKKLILVNVKEKRKSRSTQLNIYDEAHDILKDLNARTGLSFSLLANKMIKFAYDYIEIDGEEEE